MSTLDAYRILIPYEYRPLRNKEIRLITLSPGAFDSARIHLLLHNKILTAGKDYEFEAISYAWGSTENPTNIWIGPGKNDVLTVTQNLVDALRHLRYEEKSRCMAGPEAHNSTKAMLTLEHLASKTDVDWAENTMKPSSIAVAENELHWADATQALPYEKDDIIPLNALLHRSWFERLWVLQEIQLANPKAIIMCGLTSNLWQAVRRSVFCFYFSKTRRASSVPEFRARKIMIFRMNVNLTFPLALSRLLLATMQCKCSDPRDRIYALLSLCSDQNFDIKPGYTQTVAQVYQSFSLRYVELYNEFWILIACEMRDTTPSMPTWIPDWSTGSLPKLHAFKMFSANAGCNHVGNYLGNGVLQITGTFLATVLDVRKIDIDYRSPNIANWTKEHAPVQDLRGKYITGGNWLEAYCRTICGDYFGDFYVPARTNLSTFQQYKDALYKCLTADEVSAELWSPPDGHGALMLGRISDICQGRSYFTTKEGHIGLGPKFMRTGDEIYVTLGCESPLVLRRTASSQYQVVWACYMHGIMYDEAILGPLPHGYRHVQLRDKQRGGWYTACQDITTGETRFDDPRIKPWTAENAAMNWDDIPDLTLEDVQGFGVKLQKIELV